MKKYLPLLLFTVLIFIGCSGDMPLGDEVISDSEAEVATDNSEKVVPEEVERKVVTENKDGEKEDIINEDKEVVDPAEEAGVVKMNTEPFAEPKVVEIVLENNAPAIVADNPCIQEKMNACEIIDNECESGAVVNQDNYECICLEMDLILPDGGKLHKWVCDSEDEEKLEIKGDGTLKVEIMEN